MAQPARAQLLHHDLLIELATLNARQVSGTEASANMASALARAIWPHLSTDAYAVLVHAPTQDEGNASASQFGARAELRVPGISFSPIEVAASLTRFGARNNTLGSQSAVIGRQHVQRANSGVFVGGGRAWAARLSERAHASNVEAGLWATRDDITASVTAQRALTTDWQLMEAAGYFLTAPARAYHVQDVTVELRAQRSRLNAYAVQSWRRGLGVTSGSSRVTTVGASLQLFAHWSISGTTGSQLADVLRGLPAARIRTLSLRWQRASQATEFSGPVRDRVRASRAPADAAPREASVERSDSASFLLLRISAPENAVVEVAGSFNDWQPLALTRDGAVFTLRIALPSGAHRLAVRVNGGAWRAATGLAQISDGLGGENSLVVVP